jgi:hypothetical protein
MYAGTSNGRLTRLPDRSGFRPPSIPSLITDRENYELTPKLGVWHLRSTGDWEPIHDHLLYERPFKMNSIFPVVWVILWFAAVFSQAPPTNVDYFPVGTFCVPLPTKGPDPNRDEMNRRLDERRRNGISRQLRDMNEPSLWEASQKQNREIYRFIWLRSFHQPVAVRVTIGADGSGDLVVKVLSGKGGYDPGSLVLNQQSHVSQFEAQSFIEKLSNANFWSLSTIRIENAGGRAGASWIMEGTKNGTYHIVDRWSPHTDSYRDACTYLVFSLAELKIPDREIY